MAINFPDSPILNEEFTISGRTWIWTGDYWKSKTSSVSGDSLPAQSGHAGEFLTTDGTTASWTAVNVSATTVSDTPPTSPIEGDAWFRSSTGQFFVYYDSFWVEVGGSSSGVSPVNNEAVSTDITLVANSKYFVDTTSARVVTLPLAPALGDQIELFDAAGNGSINNVTVNNNSEKINGILDSAIIDVDAFATVFVYTGATYGWRMI